MSGKSFNSDQHESFFGRDREIRRLIVADADYLVDTSVPARAAQARVGERLEDLARAGRLYTCRLIDLEVVYASRAREVAEVIGERRALPEAPITPGVMERSLGGGWADGQRWPSSGR